jgi:hypothetical protein
MERALFFDKKATGYRCDRNPKVIALGFRTTDLSTLRRDSLLSLEPVDLTEGGSSNLKRYVLWATGAWQAQGDPASAMSDAEVL